MHCKISIICFVIGLVLASSSYSQDNEQPTVLPGPRTSSTAFVRYFEQVKPKYIDLVDSRIRGISLGCTYFDDEVLETLCPSSDLLQVKGNAYGDRVTRRGFRTLLKCTNLESLKVQVPLHLDSSTLELMGELTHLREVMLFEARLEPEGVKHLQALHELKLLYLPGTNLNDAMLKDLTPLRLTRLNVSETDVTQEGLLVFRGHATLREIWVGKMEVEPDVERQLAPIKVMRREHTMDVVLGELARDSEKFHVDYQSEAQSKAP